MPSKTRSAITIFIISFFIFTVSCNTDVKSGDKELFKVVEVVDGDTFIINDEHSSRVRMLGIDTPEIINEYGPGEPFSKEARKLLEEYIGDKSVTLEYGEEKFDPYGRILAYVFVDDRFINEEMLEKGLARLFIFREKHEYNATLRKAEDTAKKTRKGIWGNQSGFEYDAGNSDFLVKPVNVKRHVDQRVVTRGKITGVRKSDKVTVLSIEDDLDIVIFADNLGSFTHFGINPAEDYTGQLVKVIGKVTVYRGRTQIVVNHPVAIKKMQ